MAVDERKGSGEMITFAYIVKQIKPYTEVAGLFKAKVDAEKFVKNVCGARYTIETKTYDGEKKSYTIERWSVR